MRNVRKHGPDFSFAALVFADPRAVAVFDRTEDGEEGRHTIGEVGPGLKVLLAVRTDPGRGSRLRVIGLQAATRQERKRHEEGLA